MSALSIFFLCLVCFEVGWSVSWFVFNRYIHTPLRMNMIAQNDHISKFLDGQIKNLKGILDKIPGKEADGSMISPIQINPEQQ